MSTYIIKELNTADFKITVEERPDNSFIATYWDKSSCHEVDRIVFEFETFGGACDQAFDLLTERVIK